MSENIYFTRWLAAIGVLGGVAIALVLPYFVFTFDHGLSTVAQLFLIVLALLGGLVLAAISAVVGIAVPHHVSSGMSVSCEANTEVCGSGKVRHGCLKSLLALYPLVKPCQVTFIAVSLV